MKLTLLFTFIGFYAFSQKLQKINYVQLNELRFSNYHFETKRVHYMNNTSALMNNVKEFSKYSISKKGVKSLVEYKLFNQKGLLVLDSMKNRIIRYYYSDTLLSKIVNESFKSRLMTEFKYNEKNLISKISHFNKEKKIREEEFLYNELGKKIEIKNTVFTKKSKSQVYKLVYEYDSTGKISKESYFENDLLKRIWNYTCNEKGTLTESSNKQVEATSSTCQYEEEANDGTYKLFKRVISNGIVYLYEKQYSKDSVLLLSKTFINENQLVNEVFYEKNRVTNLHYTKGMNYSKTTSFFDEKGNLIAYIYYNKKGKSYYDRQLFYNNKNLIEKEISRNSLFTFEYVYY